MSGMLRKKWVVGLLGCLATGWLVIAANAEDKQAPPKQTKQATVPKVKSQAVKPKVKRAAKKTQPIFYPELTKRELKIEEALNANAECHFSETPLSEVIAIMSKRHGLPMLLLEDKLKEEGLTKDEPVSLSVKGLALKKVLKLILKPIGLTYLVDQELLKITTIVHEDEVYQTRVYPVGDLGNTPEFYYELGSIITSPLKLGFYRVDLKDPFPLLPLGGGGGGFFQVNDDPKLRELDLRPQVSQGEYGGTIVVVPFSESLVIGQTYQVHNEIVELLTQLRRIRDLE